MGLTLDKRRSQSLEPRTGASRRGRRLSGEPAPAGIWIVPARWLVIALAIAKLLVAKGAFAKVGAVGLVWSFAPRKLKMLAAGVAAAATLVLAGSLSAIALLALQLG
jgi:hypothetical protein